jgi:hypothetical protein
MRGPQRCCRLLSTRSRICIISLENDHDLHTAGSGHGAGGNWVSGAGPASGVTSSSAAPALSIKSAK